MHELKLATFNLRCDQAHDGEHDFRYRCAGIAEAIRDKAPDVLGLQEVTPTMVEALVPLLPGYLFVGNGRGARFDGERSPLAIRTSTLELHALETFWLSETPDQPGSRYASQSICPRVCTYARLYHPASGRRLWLYNTHLDHVSGEAQAKGLLQILARLAENSARLPLPSFVTGDFNFQPNHENARLFGTLRDLTSECGGTFHGYEDVNPALKIDYILADSLVDGEFSVETWHKDRAGNLLSDHDAVVVRWRFASIS